MAIGISVLMSKYPTAHHSVHLELVKVEWMPKYRRYVQLFHYCANDWQIPMKFFLELELGSEYLTTPRDVAWFLSKIAQNINQREVFYPTSTDIVRDHKGTTVGSWRVE